MQQPPEGSYQPPVPQQTFQTPPPQPAFQQPTPQQPYPYQPPQPPFQQMPYPYQPPMQQVNVSVNVGNQRQHGFLARALYFIFIGSWLGYFWLMLGFGLCAFIVTIPLGLAMLNRIPQVMTLRSSSANATQTNVNVSTGYGYTNVNVNVQSGVRQSSFLVRALYYCFIGCWLGFLWANIAYFLCLMIVTLPLGVMMFNRLPAVLTLRKS